MMARQEHGHMVSSMSSPAQIVHVVDDDESFLAAVARLLRASGFTVKTFVSAGEFLAQCVAETSGCVVADLRMPGISGLELQSALAQTSNPLPIVFLTGAGDIRSSVSAMRGGAEDFLEKCAAKEQLIDSVRRSLVRDWREREKRGRQRRIRAAFDALSARQREVLTQVVRGRLNKQIAADLGIHERTVKLHRKAVLTKLSVHSVAELTRIAEEAGSLMAAPRTFP
jgi:FixJ family two-component response regulator